MLAIWIAVAAIAIVSSFAIGYRLGGMDAYERGLMDGYDSGIDHVASGTRPQWKVRS